MRTDTMVRRSFNIFIITFVLLITWLCLFHPDWIVGGLPKAGAESLSAKTDDPCTGQETVGRCADKCPNPTDTLQGYDKVTGAAVCRPAVTGCPSGDSIPLGPQCDKIATEQAAPADTAFAGK